MAAVLAFDDRRVHVELAHALGPCRSRPYEQHGKSEQYEHRTLHYASLKFVTRSSRAVKIGSLPLRAGS